MLLKVLLKKHTELPWPVHLALSHLATAWASLTQTHLFADVRTYCSFIGHSRSGHSVIAALLDAHPNIVMAHELRAIKYISTGYDRTGLYYLLLQNTRIRGHSWERRGSYTYDVPGQWQGEFTKIRVIGDKHGQLTVSHLAADPSLLQRLRDTVQVPLRFIHVVRNPFDNIATIALRLAKNGEPDLETAIERYFRTCEAVMTVKSWLDPVEVIDLRHEAFVDSPVSELRQLCLQLGAEATSEYLEACAGVVFRSPHQSRHKLAWTASLRQAVEHQMQQFPFLERYTFEDV